MEHQQYLVKADGLGRTLFHNRCHIRKINPETRDPSAFDVDLPIQSKPAEGGQNTPVYIAGQLQDGTQVISPIENDDERTADTPPPCPALAALNDDKDGDISSIPKEQHVEPPLRRSARVRNPPKILSPTMHGKHHSEVSH